MFDHASMNRAYRLVWSDRLNAYVAAAETAKGRGQRAVRRVRTVAAALLALLSTASVLHAQPAPTQLPTGGKVVAGQASIAQSAARLNINQTSNRAVIDWNTFNVGSSAQVNFNQPSAQSVTLNRVLDAQPSQIFGRITANGQVFLTNPNGVYFSPTASVDVGGLTATTHSISNADFMAGKFTFDRNGTTGAVVNQGNLKAALGGYIALLAPEVRNEGVIVAQAGTVALAAGEAITLNFNNDNALAGITVTPSQINVLVDNKQAVLAPGGVIILSAQAADRLQGGVVKNSGTLEAGSITQRAGRIVLEASDRIENAGTISAAGGGIALRASNTLVQSTSGRMDVSGDTAGGITLKADRDIQLQGSVLAEANTGNGGTIQIQSTPGTPGLPVVPTTVTIANGAQLRAGSARARGGAVTVEGDFIRLADNTLIDARGATGGGVVRIGGDWQGSSSLYQAKQVIMDNTALIDVSATRDGNGGKAVLWSDITYGGGATVFNGRINATGEGKGKGGQVETSGHVLSVRGNVTTGKGGLWLLDPFNVTIDSGPSMNMDGSFNAVSSPAAVFVDTIAAALTAGGDVTVTTGIAGSEAGDITLNSNIVIGAMATDATLTLKAANSIFVNAGSTIDATQNGNTGKLNVVLWSNSDGGSYGRIEVRANASIKSNGGNIVLGGGSDITTGYAMGNGTGETGRGIWLRDGTLLNAGGGNITLRGQGFNGGEGIGLGAPGGGTAGTGSSVLTTSGTGTITLDGVGASALVGSPTSGIKLHNNVRIQSADGAIQLIGMGGDSLTTSDDNSGVFAGPGTHILSANGPITLTGTAGTGASTVSAGLRFSTGTNYIGGDGTNVSGSLSDITLNADAMRTTSANTIIDSSGALFLQPATGSFSNTFNWGGSLSGANFVGGNSLAGFTINNLQGMSSINLGTFTNVAGITLSSPLTLNGALNLTGNNIQLNQTLAVGSMTVNHSGLLTTADGVPIAAQNGFAQQGSGDTSLGGDISTNAAPISFDGALVVRDQSTLSTNGATITLNGAATGGVSGTSRLTLDSGVGGIRLLGGVTNFDRLTLTSSGSTTQSAPVNVSNLLLNGQGGDYWLSNSSNQVGTLAANVDTGSVVFKNATPLTIGSIGGVNGVTSTNGVLQIQTLNGAALTVNQPVFAPSPTLLADGNLTLAAPVSANAGDVLLVSGGVFVNAAGANAIVTPGRWLIYSNAPSANTFGGLDSGNTGLFGKTFSGYGPADVATDGYSGNRYLFADTQTITLTTVNAGNIYGNTPVSLANSYTVSPINTYGGAILAPSLTGAPVIDSAGASSSAHAGSYAITADVSGVSVNAAGYNIVNADLGTLTITPRPVTLMGSRSYDATTAIAANQLTVGNIVNADSVSLNGGTGVLASKNAGTQALSGTGSLTLSNADYTLIGATTAVAITPATLAISGVTAQNRIYDATTSAALSGNAVVAPLGADAVTVSGSGVALFNDKNVGIAKPVTVNGYTLSGADAGNYIVAQPTGLSANISAASLLVGGISTQNKIYDATSNATWSGVASVAPLGIDTVSLSGSATAQFSDKNVGANKSVTVTGYTLSGADAGNYSLIQPTGLTASITPATLAVGGVTAQNKVYDAATSATLSGNATVTPLGADAVNVSGSALAQFNDKNVGANKSVTVTGYSLSGADASNYTVAQPTGLSANVSPATLAISGVAAQNKVYDATTNATLSGIATVTPLGADAVNLSGSASVLFNDKNVGANKSVTVSGYTLSGADAGNYTLVQPAGLSASISPATVTVAGITAQSKVYDATTSAALNGTATVTPLGADVLSISGSGLAQFGDKQVGVNKAVTVSGFSLQGTDAGNYTLMQPTGLAASITPATLAVGGVTAQNKVYDATTSATLSGNATVTPLGMDAVNVSGSAVAQFGDKNVGTNKLVTVTGYTLSGADAGNYTVAQPTGLTASVSPATLAISGVTAQNKVYDATTAAALGGNATVTPLGADAVNVSGNALALFNDKNVGTNKLVTVTGYTLSGADAGNYIVAQPTGLTASVSPATLAISGVTAQNKVYDATIAAMLSGTATVSALSADVVSVSGSAVALFADKNVGVNKSVTTTGYTLSGADAGNYTVVQPAGLTASVAPATLTVGGVSVQHKTYDATTGATLSGSASVTPLGTDTVNVSGIAVAQFADKNAGANKSVSVSGFTLQGADAANYTLMQPGGLIANISQATLTVGGVSAQNKIYDATAVATLSGSAAVTPLGNDQVNVAGVAIALFDDRNVGVNKPVTVSGFVLSGADAGNYSVVQPGGLSANITAPPVIAAPSTSLVLPPLPVTTTQNNDELERRASLGGGTLDVTAAAGAEVAPTIVAERSEGADAYSFRLPGELLAMLAAAGNRPIAVAPRGKTSLPNWLRFDAVQKQLTARSIPLNGLPMDVVFTLGERKAVVKLAAALPPTGAAVALATGAHR